MFSGIVQGIGLLREMSPAVAGVATCKIENNTGVLRGLAIGASIAVDGVCLSKTGGDDDAVFFDLTPETLSRTTLAAKHVGDSVNLERALRVGDENGGHAVSGHVHCTAQIKHRQMENDAANCDIVLGGLPSRYHPYLVPKGFVAVDGISLTVGEVTSDGCYLHLIPETLRQTTLSGKQVGDNVNIECDQTTVAIIDTITRLLPQFIRNQTD